MARQEHLFPEMHRARYGAGRQQRLLLPRLLADTSQVDSTLRRPSRDRAQEIICRWAELEKSGKLEEMTETTLEGEFLSEVFGDALGYILFSENLDLWNIHPKYSVNGGQADAALGIFRSGQTTQPRAVIELKGPTKDLDRDRFNGRTAALKEPEEPAWFLASYGIYAIAMTEMVEGYVVLGLITEDAHGISSIS
jgi:hypothetical protein